MKKNTLKTILGLLTVLFISTSYAKDWKTIRIGVEGAYPPYSQTNPDGSVTGFDIDIANALCAEIGAKCVLVVQDWDGMIPSLLARKFDAIIASMSITEERKKRVDFTNKYYSSPAKFVRKKGSGIVILNSILKGKSVGVQEETIMDRFVTDNWGDIVKVRRYGSQEKANLDLISGRLDLVFSEIAPAKDFIKSDSGKGFELVGPSYSEKKWFGEGIGIAIRKKDQELKEKLNKAIVSIRNNGVYKKIQDKYFDYDIYGEE